MPSPHQRSPKSTGARRDRGVYYTPPALARHVARTALELLAAHAKPPQTVLDPACGDGRLLAAVARQHLASVSSASPLACYGVDIDMQALAVAEERLSYFARSHTSPSPPPSPLTHRWQCADALLTEDWAALFPDVCIRPDGGFDLVVSNPPFVNCRRGARVWSDATKRRLAERFRCARGAYDHFVLFIELAVQRLATGGLLAIVVPNKWQSARYAAPCRQLLESNGTLLRIDDFSELDLFPGARVYPHVLYWIKTHLPRPFHAPPTLRVPRPSRSKHHELNADPNDITLSHKTLTAERLAERCDCVRLSELAEVASGATGFQAERLARAIEDVERLEATHFPWIATGNIDRYVVRWGSARFMKRRFERPALRRSHPLLSKRKRELYAQRKLVVAGLTRRLEVAWDAVGHALGVQTFAITPTHTDPWYLLGLLNSKLLTWIYRQANGGQQMRNRYACVHKRPLLELPIVSPACAGADAQQHIQAIGLAAQQIVLGAPDREQLERQIDRATYALYQLRDEEITRVEQFLRELE